MAIMTEDARMHIGVTVVRVEPLPNGWVRLWSKEYPDEAFDVGKAFVLRIGYRGPLAVRGS